MALDVRHPLTTYFTAPPDCSTAPATYTNCPASTSCSWPPPSCYPTGASTQTDVLGPASNPGTILLYSPGVAPPGWQTPISQPDALYTYDLSSPAMTWTQLALCPPGLQHNTEPQSCATTIPTPVQVSVTETDSQGAITVSVATVTSLTVVAPNMFVLWQSSDLPNFTPFAAPLEPGARSRYLATRTGTSGGSGSAATAVGVHGNDTSGSLSADAKIGIVVGVVGGLAVLLLLATVMWVLQYRRRAKLGKTFPDERYEMRSESTERIWVGGKSDKVDGIR